MRIAFIGGFAFSPKGTMRARAHPMAAELVKQGHEVTFFLPPYDNLADLGREWEQEGVRIRNVGEPSRHTRNRANETATPKMDGGVSWFSYPRLLVELVAVVNRYAPDLVHVFKPKGFAGAAGSYLLLKGNRVVLDCDDWEGWGGWNDVKDYPWIVKEYIDRQEHWMTRRAHAVTTASRVLEGRVALVRGDSDSVYYVPNCGAAAANSEIQKSVRSLSPVETRRELGLPGGPLVLYSGHFGDEQGVAMFQRSVARVARRLPMSLVLVGDGANSSRIKEEFQSGLNTKTYFFPQLAYQDFLRVVWACDVAAFPYPDDSVHRAKCSARIVDYMTMGKAVLTSEVGQNPEYIVDGESGVLVAPGDEDGFAAKLELLLRNPELRARLGQNAEARIRARFQWNGEAVQSCLAAYEHVLRSSRRLHFLPIAKPQ
ncbi:MAG TPA: glycosyltransferase family 4 protein [Terriglobales bacterium]